MSSINHIPTLLALRQKRDAIRASLPTISSPEDPGRAQQEAIIAARTRTTDSEGRELLVAKDGTVQPASADVWRGLRSIAAGEVLGLTRTHSEVEVSRGMVTVTLVQPSRRDAETIRACVIEALLATQTDGHFDSVAQAHRATRPEKRLAQRVQALRGVGTKTAEDWETRRRIGVTIREIRSR